MMKTCRWNPPAVLAASLVIAACDRQEAATAEHSPAAETAAPAAAAALVSEPFTEARFKELQAGDGLVLVDVSATWCPTCRAQKLVLAQFQQQHPEVALTVLNVDFDDQKEWVKHFKVPRQSTLALYEGSEQVWFAVAEQREAAIFDALLKASGRPS